MWIRCVMPMLHKMVVCVCMHIYYIATCMRLCVCVCVWLHVFTCMYVYVACMYVYRNECVAAWTYMSMHEYVCKYSRDHVCESILDWVCICMRLWAWNRITHVNDYLYLCIEKCSFYWLFVHMHFDISRCDHGVMSDYVWPMCDSSFMWLICDNTCVIDVGWCLIIYMRFIFFYE